MKITFGLTVTIMIIFVSLFLATKVMAAVYRYDSNDVPKDIPDPGTTFSALTVPDSLVIKDVNVVLDITHTYDGDLNVYLVAPDGTEVELFTAVGDNGDDFDATVLDDEANRSIIDGSAPFIGPYQPEGNLADFGGLNAQGTWQLKITDDTEQDSGVLNSWSLLIEPCPLPLAPTHPNPPDGAINVAVNTCLSWDHGPASSGITSDIYLGTDPNTLILVASDLTEPNYCPSPLEAETWYYWRVETDNPCWVTPGPIWSFETTPAPVARCRDVTVPADKDCQAVVTIDDIDRQSYDPDGGPITLRLEPPGPYSTGQHTITLTVTDDEGASATCEVMVTVLPTAYCCAKQAIDELWQLRAQDPTSEELIQAIDWLNMSLGENIMANDPNWLVWAGPDRIAQRQGGFAGSQVFEYQQQACTLLRIYVQNGGFAFTDQVNNIWQLLAEAGKKLTQTAISDAIFQGADPAIITEAKTISRQGDAAKDRGGREICDVALPRYAEAWRKAIDSLGPDVDINRDGKVDERDFDIFVEQWLEEVFLP